MYLYGTTSKTQTKAFCGLELSGLNGVFLLVKSIRTVLRQNITFSKITTLILSSSRRDWPHTECLVHVYINELCTGLPCTGKFSSDLSNSDHLEWAFCKSHLLELAFLQVLSSQGDNGASLLHLCVFSAHTIRAKFCSVKPPQTLLYWVQWYYAGFTPMLLKAEFGLHDFIVG